MVYETIFEANKTSVVGIMSYVSEISPIFAPMMLFVLFIAVTLGSYYSQIRTRGFGDFLGSMAVGFIIIAVASVVLILSPEPIINPYVVVVCIVLAIVGVAILMTQDND